jgi:methylated-DNA-protein-cysteine methyltransferase related protein
LAVGGWLLAVGGWPLAVGLPCPLFLYCLFAKIAVTCLCLYKLIMTTPSTFFNDVYEVVKLIPKGRVTSYGAIAKYLGSAKSARVVGYAMNAAHSLPEVPAQRVVNRNGMLSGKHHFATETRMEELLEKDGVKVKDDMVVDFAKRFWDPMIELEM